MISSSRLFHILEGIWDIRRVIEGSQSARAIGTATFRKTSPNTLHYHEQGEWLGTGKFFQDYEYRLEGGVLNVYFSNGTLFYTLVHGRGEHLCGRDQYGLAYHFSPDDVTTFRIVCTVRGPEKAYSITTDFSAR